MAQYQRFLSYLFEYEGDQKKENCGFAKIEISIAARPLLHNNPSVNGNNPPRNLKELDKLVVGRQQKLAVTFRQPVSQLTESGNIDVQDALNQILSELVVVDMDVRIAVSEHI
mgnify:CR=1 FL=1